MYHSGTQSVRSPPIIQYIRILSSFTPSQRKPTACPYRPIRTCHIQNILIHLTPNELRRWQEKIPTCPRSPTSSLVHVGRQVIPFLARYKSVRYPPLRIISYTIHAHIIIYFICVIIHPNYLFHTHKSISNRLALIGACIVETNR